MRRGIVRAHQIADVYAERARASRDRRLDTAVLQVERGRVRPPPDRRRGWPASARHSPSGSRTDRAGSDPRLNRSSYRLACASAFFACAVSRASTAFACSSAASKGRGSRVKSGWPFSTLLPLRKVDGAQLPGHLGANLDRGQRFGGADGRNRDRNRLRHHLCGHDGNRSAAAGPAAASPGGAVSASRRAFRPAVGAVSGQLPGARGRTQEQNDCRHTEPGSCHSKGQSVRVPDMRRKNTVRPSPAPALITTVQTEFVAQAVVPARNRACRFRDPGPSGTRSGCRIEKSTRPR